LCFTASALCLVAAVSTHAEETAAREPGEAKARATSQAIADANQMKRNAKAAPKSSRTKVKIQTVSETDTPITATAGLLTCVQVRAWG
jgi:hypothetical protein